MVEGSFSPILMWGRAEAFFTAPVDELGGQTVYAALPWPELRPERWLSEHSNLERLLTVRIDRGEYLAMDTNLIELRGSAGRSATMRTAPT